MSKKHITIKELNDNRVYDTLYPQTSATQSILSSKTSKLYGQSSIDVDTAFYKIIEKLSDTKELTVKVTDTNGNPVQGAKINGMLNSPPTSVNGIVKGVFVSDPLTIVSPYVDLANGTANGADYVGTLNVLEVTLQSIADNSIFEYTKSTTVAFSQNVASVDICCVGGGGGGGAIDSRSYSEAAPGGGGGGIINSMATQVTAGQQYSIIVGSGGVHPLKPSSYTDVAGGSGGSSRFGNLVIANGGGGGGINRISGSSYPAGGTAGSSGSGVGGDYADVRWGQDSAADPPPPPYGHRGGSNTTTSLFNEGQVFYSGGGGSGAAYGGSPNGSNGGNLDPVTPSYGGGGGGSLVFCNTYTDPDDSSNTLTEYSYYRGSSGGPGLVVIRIHLK